MSRSEEIQAELAALAAKRQELDEELAKERANYAFEDVVELVVRRLETIRSKVKSPVERRREALTRIAEMVAEALGNLPVEPEQPSEPTPEPEPSQ